MKRFIIHDLPTYVWGYCAAGLFIFALDTLCPELVFLIGCSFLAFAVISIVYDLGKFIVAAVFWLIAAWRFYRGFVKESRDYSPSAPDCKSDDVGAPSNASAR